MTSEKKSWVVYDADAPGGPCERNRLGYVSASSYDDALALAHHRHGKKGLALDVTPDWVERQLNDVRDGPKVHQ
jgi:hypothetical protein